MAALDRSILAGYLVGVMIAGLWLALGRYVWRGAKTARGEPAGVAAENSRQPTVP